MENTDLIQQIEQTLQGNTTAEQIFDLTEDIIGESPMADDVKHSRIMELREQGRLDLLPMLAGALEQKANDVPTEDADFAEMYRDQARKVQELYDELIKIIADNEDFERSGGVARVAHNAAQNTFSMDGDLFKSREKSA